MMSHIVIVVGRAERSDQDSLRKHRPGGIPGIGSVAVPILVVSLLALAAGSSALAQDAGAPSISRTERDQGGSVKAVDGQGAVKIGVLAKRGPERCLEKWEPTAEYLTSQIPGHSFTIVPLGFDDIDPAVQRGEVDFILANSSFYVGLEKLYGVNRIATLKNRRTAGAFTIFGGVIFCRTDRHDIQNLEDLKGKTFMAVKETSFGGWQMAWRELKERGIDPYHDFRDLSFGGTHDAVVYAVRDGKVDAGTVRTDTIERMALEGKISLEDFNVFEHDHIGEMPCYFPFLHSTNVYPEWPFAVVKHTPDELAGKVAVALLNMSPESQATQAANCAGWTIPLNYQPVHECLRELRVGPYKDFGKISFRDVLLRYWPWIVSATALLAVMAVVLAWALRLLRQRKQGEEALRGAKDYTDNIIKSMIDMLVVVAPDGRIVTVNESACKSLGYSEEEVIGQPASLLFSEEEEEEEEDTAQLIVSQEALPFKRTVLRRLVKDGAISNIEKPLCAKSGHTIPVLMSGSVMRDNDGTIRGIVCVAQDITERKQAEEAVRESEERHRAITETAQDAVITADATGNIRLWNAAAEKIFGFTASEAVGKNMMGLIVPPQYHEAKRKGLAEFGRTGHGAAIGNTLELTALRKDGTEFPIEISLSGYKRTGSFMAVALVRDITERSRATAELERAHTETRQLFEAISSILIGVDRDGRVAAWNETAELTFGIEADKAVGQLFGDLEIEWDQAAVAEGISECLANSKPRHLDEVRFKKPDGAYGFLSLTLNPLNAGPGKHDGFLLVAMDITNQKILQGQLGEAQKLESIGQLAAGIAHEINTPTQYVGDNMRFLGDSVQDMIKIVDRYADLLGTDKESRSWDERAAETKAALEELDADFLREEIPKAIEQSLEGVERVAKIVRSMKEFSHPGGDDKQMADLNKAIQSTIMVSRNEWKYVAEMVTDLDPSLPLVPSLLGDFNQVILNMIVNAAHGITDVVGKDSGEKGTITISTRWDGYWAEIRVGDTGTGIPEEIRSKIFNPFFTTKDVGKGTGQGLAIAHTTVVKKHGGELSVESEVGCGTTFIIRLPIEPKSATAEETPQHEEAYSLR